jgi:hypothetical protein
MVAMSTADNRIPDATTAKPSNLLSRYQAVEANQTIGDAFTSNFISSFASYCDACIYSWVRNAPTGADNPAAPAQFHPEQVERVEGESSISMTVS